MINEKGKTYEIVIDVIGHWLGRSSSDHRSCVVVLLLGRT